MLNSQTISKPNSLCTNLRTFSNAYGVIKIIHCIAACIPSSEHTFSNDVKKRHGHKGNNYHDVNERHGQRKC